jgi:hypothetical protein
MKYKNMIKGATLIFVLWIVITNSIQAFMCPEMSQTELFIHIPQSLMCDWNDCK